MHITAACETKEQFAALLALPPVEEIYVPEERMTAEEWSDAVGRCHAAGKQCIAGLPYFFRPETEDEYLRREKYLTGSGTDGWLVRNLEEAAFLQERGWPGKRIFDAGMYSWNSEACRMLRLLGADVLTAPYELTEEEIRRRGTEDTELVICGRQAVMTTVHCPVRQEHGCQKGRCEYGFFPLRDRTGAVFAAQNRCRFCTAVIYNSVPLFLCDLVRPDADWERVSFRFTDEPAGEAVRIIKDWTAGEPRPPERFTRGHFRKGVQ